MKKVSILLLSLASSYCFAQTIDPATAMKLHLGGSPSGLPLSLPGESTSANFNNFLPPQGLPLLEGQTQILKPTLPSFKEVDPYTVLEKVNSDNILEVKLDNVDSESDKQIVQTKKLSKAAQKRSDAELKLAENQVYMLNNNNHFSKTSAKVAAWEEKQARKRAAHYERHPSFKEKSLRNQEMISSSQ